MANRRTNTTESQLVCPYTGKMFPIRRSPSRQREKGHLKHIFCPYCQMDHNCIELREKDFILENGI